MKGLQRNHEGQQAVPASTSWRGAGEDGRGAFAGGVPGVSSLKIGRSWWDRVVRGWAREDSPQGQGQNPPRCPLGDSKGWIMGDRKLEFCLAVGRSRCKACCTINCQL